MSIITNKKEPLASIITEIEAGVLLTKIHFEKYISDRTIPLQERWEFWENAPDYLKNHAKWILPRGNPLREALDCNMRHRYEKVDLSWLAEDELEYNDKTDEHIWESELLEEVLKQNIATVIWDW